MLASIPVRSVPHDLPPMQEDLWKKLQINRFTWFPNDYKNAYAASMSFWETPEPLPMYEDYLWNQYIKYRENFSKKEMQKIYYAGITEKDISLFNAAITEINSAISRRDSFQSISLLIETFSHNFLPSKNPKNPQDVRNKTLSLLHAAIAAEAQTGMSNNI